MDADFLAGALAVLRERHGVPGAQLVVHADGRTHAVVAGELTAGSGAPVTTDAAFPLGSLTKPVTAALLLTLVADGDLDLDGPLAAQVPEVAAGADPRLTPRRLLSHTGGLASTPDGDACSAAEVCHAANLVHRPGAVFSYSNAGYFVVGRVAEVLTGMPWAEAVDTIVLRPLDIEPAFATGPRRLRRPVASGHAVATAGAPARPIREQSLPAWETAAGALAASALDLVRFARSRLPAGVFEDQLADTAVLPFGLADGWGLGWAAYRRAARRWYGHDGNADGTSCHLRVEPETGTAVALTTNATSGLALWEDLVPQLRTAGVDVGSYPLRSLPGDEAPVAAPPECAGRYANGGSEVDVEVREDGTLALTTQGLPAVSARCHAGLTFSVRKPTGGGIGAVGRFLPRTPGGPLELVQLGGRTARRCGGGPR